MSRQQTKLPDINGRSREDDNVPEAVSRGLWEELYHKQKQGWLTVLSGSMYPLLPVDAKILVKPVAQSDIGLGDIVVFRKHEKFVSHWVIGFRREKQGLQILQQGSRCRAPGLIDAGAVLGRVVAVRHRGMTLWLDRPLMRLRNYCNAMKLRIKHTVFRVMEAD